MHEGFTGCRWVLIVASGFYWFGWESNCKKVGFIGHWWILIAAMGFRCMQDGFNGCKCLLGTYGVTG